MAPSFPTAAGDRGTVAIASGTTITVPVPTNVADGDTLLALIYNQLGGTTLTPPSGWTQLYKTTATSTRCFYLYARKVTTASGEPANYAWTSSASARSIGDIIRVLGVSSSALDAAPTSDAYAINDVTIVDPSVTAVTADAMLLACNFANNSTAVYQTFSAAGFTPRFNSTVTSGSATSVTDLQYKQLSAAGATGTATFTMSASAPSFGGFLLTLTSSSHAVSAASSGAGVSTGAAVPTQNVGASGSGAGTSSAVEVPTQEVGASSSGAGGADVSNLPTVSVTAAGSGVGGLSGTAIQVGATTDPLLQVAGKHRQSGVSSRPRTRIG